MKKILWIILLIIVIAGIVLGIIFIKPKTNENQNTDAFNEHSSTEGVENSTSKEYEKVELDDGVLYTLTGKKEKADVVVGDKYYDTTITDMFMNYDKYKDKVIEIEGMYFINEIFTFVGRYSKSNLCPYCPEGYSYLEYQLQGNLDYKFTDTKEWIKVIGKLEKANDESSNYQDYFYIKATNIEIMNKRGQETVTN